MAGSVTGALQSSLREGTIAERAVILVGAALLLFGLWEFTQVAMGLYGAVAGGGTDASLFKPTLRFFLATVFGLVAITLATYLEFGDVDDAGH